MAWTPRRERVDDEELGLAAMCSLPKLDSFFTSFMSGKTASFGRGPTSTSRRAGVLGLRIADRAALSRSPSIGTFWAISVRLPDPQIIDFAHLSRRAPGAFDK
jgi:hypothetical protein